MTTFQCLIIGDGMAAAAAVDGISEVDSTGGIGRISMETNAPWTHTYERIDAKGMFHTEWEKE